MPAAVPARRAFVVFIACAMALSLVATLSSPVRAATFIVNSTADGSDATPGDGFCATADEPAVCTLRAAIEEANALPGTDGISIPDLSADGLPDSYTLVAELFITESVDIVGGGKALTIIDGGGENRVFRLDMVADGVVNMSGVTIRNGWIEDDWGAGIFVVSGVINLVDSVVSENIGGDWSSGGGIGLNEGASAVLSGTTVSGNEADRGAGIVVGNDASLALNLLSSVSGNGSEDPAYEGGGIWSQGTVTVTGSKVTGNRAYLGGGIYNYYGTLTVTGDSEISGNFAIDSENVEIDSGDGAGIWNEGLLTVTNNSTIFGNAADEDGGGIYNSASEDGDDVTITDSVIKGNTADDDGGGIRNGWGGVVKLTNSTVGGSVAVDQNHALDDGGGIWSDGNIELTTSTVARNHATDNGGGINMGSSGELTVDASTISRNTSDDDGGGIYSDSSDVTVTLHNSTVSGNTAFDNGGGVYSEGTLESDFTTVTLNRSTSSNGEGGGIWADGYASFYATIVANNDAGTPGTDDCEYDETNVDSFGSNIDSDDSCQFDQDSDQPDVDPMLGELLANGGPTLTHALLLGSPALDAVELAALFSQIDIALPTCPDTDQRGVLRPQDGDENGVPICDIGAFELVLIPPAASINDVTVTEGNTGTTVNAAFTVTLSRASAGQVTMSYATADGTAIAPADYQAKSGTVTFVPGDVSETITITVVGDGLDEPNETFVVNLSAAVGATIADAQGIGTILDDDVAAIAAVPTPTPGPATPTAIPVQAIAAATGTPAAVISNTAVSQTGVSPIPTIAFALILLASLATLAYANLKTVRRRR